MQSKLEARLEQLADSFVGSRQRFGSYTVTHIGLGILRVDGEGVQYTPTVILGWLHKQGVTT